MSVGDKPKEMTQVRKKKLNETKEEKTKAMIQPKKVRIVNTGKSVNGTELTGKWAELNEKFRGDQFQEPDSFHASVEEPRRSELVNANSKMTCPLNGNLDGHLKANDAFQQNVSDHDKQELADLRKNAEAITNETVMQKVIPYGMVQNYINQGWGTVRNCCSKAEDTAPFTGNADEAYRNLRLDYKGGGYKELAEQGGDIYVMRFTSDICPDNTMIPDASNGNMPPCTETGIIGGNDYLIPETLYSDSPITDGAIYKINKDGKESMAAGWDRRKGQFQTIK